MDLLTDGLTRSELQSSSSSSKGTRDIQGGTELSSFRVRARGAALSQTEELVEATASWLSPPPPCVQTQADTISESPSNSFHLPCPSDSLRLRPTQLLGTPKLLPVAFLYNWPTLAHAADISKISQSFTKPNQAASGFSMSHTSLAEQPKPGNSDSWPWFTVWPLKAPPSTAQAVAISGILYGSEQMAPGRAQTVAKLGLQ